MAIEGSEGSLIEEYPEGTDDKEVIMSNNQLEKVTEVNENSQDLNISQASNKTMLDFIDDEKNKTKLRTKEKGIKVISFYKKDKVTDNITSDDEHSDTECEDTKDTEDNGNEK